MQSLYPPLLKFHSIRCIPAKAHCDVLNGVTSIKNKTLQGHFNMLQNDCSLISSNKHQSKTTITQQTNTLLFSFQLPRWFM